MSNHSFDEAHVVHELKHFLPAQQALKDFIHHNSLHAFQHMKFYDAIFKASKIFGFQVHLQLPEYRAMYKTGRIREDVLQMVIANKKGNNAVTEWKEKLINQDYDTLNHPRIGQLRKYWKDVYHLDLDNKVHPLLFRILCAFLDQGIAIDSFPVVSKPFIESIRELEQNSFVSFFKTKVIRQKFITGNYSISELLKTIVGKDEYFGQYIFDQQFAHPGWSGFVSAVEDNPQTLLDRKQITLKELLEFELLMELDVLHHVLGKNWQPLASHVTVPPVNLFADVTKTELAEVIELWQDAFEWSYYDSVLKGILLASENFKTTIELKDSKAPLAGVGGLSSGGRGGGPSLQAIFCIDEREDSIRRHIEAVDKNAETFGAPGFFGVEFYFQQEGGKFYDKLCPAPVTPKYLIKEHDAKSIRKGELIYTKFTHGILSGFILSIGFGFWAFVKKLQLLFRPKMSPAISEAYAHMDKLSTLTIENKNPADIENGLQIGYTLDEMVTRGENFLRGIGMVKNFAPIIYFVAHGSSSANNPHHGAHDCGACSGRPGATNARVQSFILNHKKVRAILATKGIVIPDTTQFIGSMHDTAADVWGYYDEDLLTPENAKRHLINKHNFETALNLNAKERSRRFASINTKQELEQVRKAIHSRSVSLFEPRPELGHGTNTLAIIGRRQTTKGLFLDRRAFLNSYDYSTDPDGAILTAVMRPIGLVCGGINLEYYFSRVDNIKMGAGTKLPHNVMGLFGVANSSDGDLRPGLPWQMIEVHDPVRLLVIVEHLPDIVLKAIQSSPEVFEWYKNEWVHIVALDPIEKQFYYFKDGAFAKYEPITNASEIKTIHNMEEFIEGAKEMETNNIVHATEENLPVYLLD